LNFQQLLSNLCAKLDTLSISLWFNSVFIVSVLFCFFKMFLIFVIDSFSFVLLCFGRKLLTKNFSSSLNLLYILISECVMFVGVFSSIRCMQWISFVGNVSFVYKMLMSNAIVLCVYAMARWFVA